MTKKQQAVMWMGLLLIILRLFTTSQWKSIWNTILQGSPAQDKRPGLKIPGLPKIDPLNPIPGGGLPGKIFGI